MIKKTSKRITATVTLCFLIIAASIITSCGNNTTSSVSPSADVVDEPAAEETNADEPLITVNPDDTGDAFTPAEGQEDEADTDTEGNAEEENNTEEENSDTASDTAEETLPPAASNSETVYKGENDHVDVVWLGDSLTQGSLGWDNNNKDNPQAPWRVLADISGWNVTGAGYFGYRTDEIFWSYTEFGGVKDPSSIYVFWVGSNDFARSVDNIYPVMDSIDHFMEIDNLKKYLVLGTTNRGDMDPNAYKGINQKFEEKYGDNYLDIMPYVEYGPDNIHLTESSSKAVAEAVYNKLKELY